MAPHSFDQLCRFTTDAVGIERTLRGFQAIVQIVWSIPIVFDIFIYTWGLATAQTLSPSVTHVVLLSLCQRLSVIRRFFKLFRFLGSFNAAQKIYTSISPTWPSGKRRPAWVRTEEWIGVFQQTFDGMHFMLEDLCTVNDLQIDGLALWSPKTNRAIFVESQRFWLISLIGCVITGLLKMLKVMAYTPVPATGDAFSQGKKEGPNSEGGRNEKEKETKEETEKAGDLEGFNLSKELQRLRKISKESKHRRVLWRREVKGKIRGLGRITLANALDTLLALRAIGYPVHAGVVGVVMLITTLLTGVDAWDRCGREVVATH